jgi:DNA-binding GntR family transcriptional regulator
MTTRAEQLCAEIADAILSGALTPGSRLDEQGLADRYQVSRTPVREALRLLAATGLIEVRPRRGATVAQISSAQLVELFVAMGEIEATCARLSALSMSPIERRQLEALHERMARIVETEDEAAYAQANVAFHSRIYKGTHNSVLEEVATGLRRRLSPFRRAQFRARGRLPLSHAEHGLVLDAILRGDADQAHQSMLRHVNLVEDAFEQLSASGAEPASAARESAAG